MIQRTEVLSFPAVGKEFTLKITQDPTGELHLDLYCDDRPVKKLHRRTLTLLRYMAQRPGEAISTDTIANDLWPNASANVVEKYVSLLRHALNDADHKVIATGHKEYEFLPDVTRSGDLGEIEAYSEWSTERFFHLMDLVRPNQGPYEEDLRILISGVEGFVEQLKLDRLIKERRIRVRVLMIDPSDEALFKTRNALRKDKPQDQSFRELKDQVRAFRALAEQYPFPTQTTLERDRQQAKGGLELRFYSTMPSVCVFHASTWAIFGVFLAHDTYGKGPMIEIRGETRPWDELYRDWQARWIASAPHS